MKAYNFSKILGGIIGITVILFFSSCAKPPSPEPLPEWVLAQTSNDLYWHGLGIGETREIARNQAINEIASQISIQITTSLSRIITENNFDINEFTRSVIDTRLDNSLQDIELVNTHLQGKNHYILARLSKEKYYTVLEEKKRNAISSAIEHIYLADKNFSISTFSYLNGALQEIRDYLDQELLVNYPMNSDENINLLALIKKKILNSLNRIQLEPITNEYSARIGYPENLLIQVRCRDQKSNEVLSGFPLISEMGANIFTSETITGKNGIAEFGLNRIIEKNSIQYLTVHLDIAKFFEGIPDYFNIEKTISTQIKVNVRGMNIYGEFSEKNLGTDLNKLYVTPVIKMFFTDHFNAKFTNKKTADLIIQLEASSKNNGGKPEKILGNTIYQTNSEVNITIIENVTGNEIFQTTVKDVKGVSYNSFLEAGNNSLRKLAKKVEKETIPQIIALIENN